MVTGEEIIGKHVACLITTHIDDIKGSGNKTARTVLLDALRRDYGGDVKMEIGEFEHTGIKHVQSKDFNVYTHPNRYVTEIS